MLKNLLQFSEKKGSLGDRFRAKRFLFFEKCISSLALPLNILDVGGTESFWLNRGYNNKPDINITLLNLSKTDVSWQNMKSIKGNATDLSEFDDNEFDIVFSNSVIEHLYNLDNQKKMRSECLRVGKYHFIQTPNKYFFIEPHFRLPFFNFLPKKLALKILTKTSLSLGKKWEPQEASEWLEEIRLLSKAEMHQLFINSSIYTEKFLIFDKSYTVHNFYLEN